MTIEYKEMLKQLHNGYTFEFQYMNKLHKLTGIDSKAYVLITYTEDTKNTREMKQIVSRKVVHEMYKGMTDITYAY